MTRCLRDRTLWLMSEGEGRQAQWAHLQDCLPCAARYQRLKHDLAVLGSMLNDRPPLQRKVRPPHALRAPWMAAAALAATLAIVWGTLWLQRPMPLVIPPETHYEAIWPFLGEISDALFSMLDGGDGEVLVHFPDLTDLEAALQGEQPCEPQASFFGFECGEDGFLLLAEGQSVGP